MHHGNIFFLLQEMTLFEPWQTCVQDRHQIFHWGDAEQLPTASVGSDDDTELRRFTHPCARFASERLRLQAMRSLQPTQMANIALACMGDGVPFAIQYWWETLYLQFLQVSSHLCPCTTFCSQCFLSMETWPLEEEAATPRIPCIEQPKKSTQLFQTSCAGHISPEISVTWPQAYVTC